MSSSRQVHLFVGDDEFPLNRAARQLIDELIPETEQVFGLEVVDGRADKVEDALTSIKRCQEAVLTRGFCLGQGKLVWWRDVSFLADGQTSQAEAVKAELRAFAAMLSDPGPGTNTLLITTPKIDRRSSFSKACVERYTVREFAVPEKAYLAENQARATIRQTLKEYGLKAGKDVEDALFGRTGSDARQIASEVEKLFLYAQGRPAVTIADVEAIVSVSVAAAMWDLQDAVGEKDLPGALRTLRDLIANKESPMGIIVSVASRVRDLMLYREALDKGWLKIRDGYSGGKQAEWTGLPAEAVPVLTVALRRAPKSIHPFAAGKMAMQSRNYTSAELRKIQLLVMQAHEDLVSSSLPQSGTLELMLIRMLSASKG